jgi:hypothetical protein
MTLKIKSHAQRNGSSLEELKEAKQDAELLLAIFNKAGGFSKPSKRNDHSGFIFENHFYGQTAINVITALHYYAETAKNCPDIEAVTKLSVVQHCLQNIRAIKASAASYLQEQLDRSDGTEFRTANVGEALTHATSAIHKINKMTRQLPR